MDVDATLAVDAAMDLVEAPAGSLSCYSYSAVADVVTDVATAADVATIAVVDSADLVETAAAGLSSCYCSADVATTALADADATIAVAANS